MIPSNLSASLWVGDLALDVTEALLQDLFKKVGPVLSSRVCRHSTTHVSLGYGYVNFEKAEDAERARETLNFYELHGKPIRIMPVQRDAQQRKTGKGNVIVKNLSKTVDNASLYDTFSQFGNILSCKVATNAEGEHQGIGFVQFDSDENAKLAIEKANGTDMGGSIVEVEQFIPTSERIAHSQANFTCLEVRGMKEGCTEEELQKFFEQFGHIERLKLITDRRDEQLAFLTYTEHPSAVAALEGAAKEGAEELCAGPGGFNIKRAPIRGERGGRGGEQPDRNPAGALFVGNLADDVTDEMLRAAFSPFGALLRAQVMLSQFGVTRTRGFGFVTFVHAEDAETACVNMNNAELNGSRVVVNAAHRKRDQQGGPNQMGGQMGGQHMGGQQMGGQWNQMNQGMGGPMGQQMYPGMMGGRGMPQQRGYGMQPHMQQMNPMAMAMGMPPMQMMGGMMFPQGQMGQMQQMPMQGMQQGQFPQNNPQSLPFFRSPGAQPGFGQAGPFGPTPPAPQG